MLSIETECEFCKGTGLYIGMCERNGCAVICTSCRGSGKIKFNYNSFTGRKKRSDVDRVFKSSFGYAHSAKDVFAEDGKEIKFSQGGCTYEEWESGVEPKPVKDLICPYMWNNKGMGNEPLQKCQEGVSFGRCFSDCKYFDEKNLCWKEYEEKQ